MTDAVPPLADTAKATRRWPVRLAGLLFILVLGGALIWYRDEINLALLAERRAVLRGFVDARPWTAALVYFLGYALAVAIALPGAVVFTAAGGFAFGWQLGAPLALLASTVGGTLFFVAARGMLGQPLGRRAGPRIRRVVAGFRADAFSFLLFLRLTPLFPFWMVNVAAALAAIPLRVFVLATLIGAAPVSLALSVAGAGLDHVLSERIEARGRCLEARRGPCGFDIGIGSLLSPAAIVGLGALGLVALFPTVARSIGRRSADRLAARDGL